MRKPKNYRQFTRALELCDQITKECPKVSVILNCQLNCSRLKEPKTILAAKNFNVLENDKDCFIFSDKKNFIVFNFNEIFSEIFSK